MFNMALRGAGHSILRKFLLRVKVSRIKNIYLSRHLRQFHNYNINANDKESNYIHLKC